MSAPIARCSGATRMVRRCAAATRKVRLCGCFLPGMVASASNGLNCAGPPSSSADQVTIPSSASPVQLGEVFLFRIAGTSAASIVPIFNSLNSFLHLGIRIDTSSFDYWVRSPGRWWNTWPAGVCDSIGFDRWYMIARDGGTYGADIGRLLQLFWSTEGDVSGAGYLGERLAEITDCKMLIRQEFATGPQLAVAPLHTLPHTVSTYREGGLAYRHWQPIAFGGFAGKRVRVRLAGTTRHALITWRMRMISLGSPGQPVIAHGAGGQFLTEPVIWSSSAPVLNLDQVFDFTNAATWPSNQYGRAVLMLEFDYNAPLGALPESVCTVNTVAEE